MSATGGARIAVAGGYTPSTGVFLWSAWRLDTRTGFAALFNMTYRPGGIAGALSTMAIGLTAVPIRALDTSAWDQYVGTYQTPFAGVSISGVEAPTRVEIVRIDATTLGLSLAPAEVVPVAALHADAFRASAPAVVERLGASVDLVFIRDQAGEVVGLSLASPETIGFPQLRRVATP